MTTQGSHSPSVLARTGSLLWVRLLVPLLFVDLAFVVASVVHEARFGIDVQDPSPWLLEADGGWSEVWGYCLQATLVLSLLVLAVRTRHAVWAAWALLYAAALADDGMRLHENKGAWLAEMLGKKLWFPPDGFLGLRANDLGEVLVWGLLAVVPLGLVVLLHRRSDRWNRRGSIAVAVLVAAYVFFGGVVDQLHVLVLDTPLEGVMGTVEDGGELVVLSVTVAFVAGLLGRARQVRSSASPGPEVLAAAASSSPA
ncbi:hypothetical protein [Geodermatophilus sp. URMC 65]